MSNKKQIDIDFFGQKRTLRFNNYMIEHLVKSCAGGDYSTLRESLSAILAQSSLLAAAHIVDAALVGDDYVTGSTSRHTIAQCREYCGDVPYIKILDIINAFNYSQGVGDETDIDNDSPGQQLPVAETPKKKYRGKKS